ncbi:RNA polymerase sigma factor [Geodermatophilus sp. SYSU D00710]
MTADPGPDASAVAAAVADAHRREWAFVLAATVRVTRDIDLAEECVQEAFATALTEWRDTGVPARPGAWLTTVARRRALNVLRHQGVVRRHLPLLVEDDVAPDPRDGAGEDGTHGYPDDRLRLVVTCCHPALDRAAQVALTLRLLCGLTTAEVARAFLVSEPTMAARLTRAKKKIAVARIPYRVPPPAELPERVDAVLAVVHLLFTTGHTVPAGEELVRRDLVERALQLCRMLRTLLPRDPAVAGLLALLLLIDARRDTRTGADGRLLLLEEQDRSRWDATAIAEGVALVREALRGRPPSRYALQAAIAAVHAEAPSWAATDWAEIVALYGVLGQVWPSPVVALNRAVAVGFASGPAAGLAALDELATEPQLAGYGYFPAARADLLRRLGRVEEARLAYTEALHLTANAVERDFLAGRLAELG